MTVATPAYIVLDQYVGWGVNGTQITLLPSQALPAAQATSSDSSGEEVEPGVVVGAVLGSVCGAALIALAGLYVWRRRRQPVGKDPGVVVIVQGERGGEKRPLVPTSAALAATCDSTKSVRAGRGEGQGRAEGGQGRVGQGGGVVRAGRGDGQGRAWRWSGQLGGYTSPSQPMMLYPMSYLTLTGPLYLYPIWATTPDMAGVAGVAGVAAAGAHCREVIVRTETNTELVSFRRPSSRHLTPSSSTQLLLLPPQPQPAPLAAELTQMMADLGMMNDTELVIHEAIGSGGYGSVHRGTWGGGGLGGTG